MWDLFQLNQITHWLDNSQVYGSDDEAANELRSFEGGFLQTSSDGEVSDLLPQEGTEGCNGNTKPCFVTGRNALIFSNWVDKMQHDSSDYLI